MQKLFCSIGFQWDDDYDRFIKKGVQTISKELEERIIGLEVDKLV
jgi:hypothetical protein